MPNEDKKIIKLVNQYGNNWIIIAQHFFNKRNP